MPSTAPTEPLGNVGPPSSVDCGVGFRLEGGNTGAAGAFVLQGGASAVAFDVARSSLPIPVDHAVTVTALSGAGASIASITQPAKNVAGRITLTNPAAMDVWVLNNTDGAAAVDVQLATFSAFENEGENSVIIEAEFNGVVVMTHGELWTAGCGELSWSETGAPNACSTGY